ncbi:MAG: PAS domain-containing protein [Desulfuromonadaceae bacterium]
MVCASNTKARHYGLDMDTIRGHTDFDLLPRGQAEKAFQDDTWVMKNRKPIKDIRETVTHKNGEIVNISVTKFPWFLPGGEIVGVMCIARDITIRERAKQKSHDLVEFLKKELLNSLIQLYMNDFKNSKSGKIVKSIVLRLRRKLNEVK